MKTLMTLLTFCALTAFAENSYITNDVTKPVPVTQTAVMPSGATAVGATSGNVANASAAATLPAVSGKTNFLTGFEITASGATAGLVVNATVTGLATGTQNYAFTFPAGVAVAALPLIVIFDNPIPASATNTAITVTLPASGAGGTNAAVNVHGFTL